MQRSIRTTLCILFVSILSISLLPVDSAYAQRGGGGGRGGGGRGGGGRGGGASPSINRSVSTQNRGNFNSPPRTSQPSVNRPQPQPNMGTVNRPQPQPNVGTVDRSQIQQNVGTVDRSQAQQNRQGNQQQRQDNRQENQQPRQDERTQRQDNRQGERTERQDNRQDFVEDNYNNGYWRGGGWYGGGYHVPPGWGWVGLTTGLIIGAAVAQPPPYYDTIYVGGSDYIYSDGVFLEPSGSEYVVVAPPVGAVVNYLPQGCTTTQTTGGTYYNCSGIYYQPVFQNGATVYQVVRL